MAMAEANHERPGVGQSCLHGGRLAVVGASYRAGDAWAVVGHYAQDPGSLFIARWGDCQPVASEAAA